MNQRPNLIIITFYLLFFVLLQGKAANKLALLIGVGEYPSNSGWADLGSKNDVEWLALSLQTQNFLPQNITTLTDNQATKHGIITTIKEQLIEKAQTGDIVYFHFSGHGQQVADDDGDEQDGYDEAIVPYDSPQKYKAGKYEGEKLIRDEELGVLLNQLRKKLGHTGHLLVLLDACHSGTGTRVLTTSRGTAIKMASEAYEDAQLTKKTDALQLPEINTEAENLAPMVAFFSAAPKQQSFEIKKDGKQYGILTYSFCKTLANLNQSISYSDLLNKIQLEATKNGLQQRPQAEGNLNLLLFNNTAQTKESYYKVLQKLDRQTLQINAGLFHNLSEKSKVLFYVGERKNLASAKPIAEGVVTRAGLIESTVKLNAPLTENQTILASKVILAAKHFDHLSLTIQLDLQNEALSQEILEQLAHYETLKITNNQPKLLLKEENQRLKIIKFNDLVLFDEPISTIQPKAITTKLLRFAQAHFLRQLELKDKNYHIKLELISPETGQVSTTFKVGDSVQLRVENIGLRSAYYQILDIMPTDDFGVAIPLDGEFIFDYSLAPGQSKDITPTFTINPPIGQELFKIIASPQPINLKEILINKGQQKASNNALGVLMQASFNGTMRKGNGVKAKNIGVNSVNCEVIND